MRKQAAHSGLINWCITLLTAAMLLWKSIPFPTENFYETAQLCTVLVDTDDGFGSGIAVVRRDNVGRSHVFVWTARHVVHGNEHNRIKVFTRIGHRKIGSMTFDARILDESESADAALLLTDAPAALFPRVEFDLADASRLGEAVFAVGNPHGPRHDGAISEGVISQFGVEFGPLDDIRWPVADQTTAALNPGSSGGPIFSTVSHRVIGMAVGSGGNGVNIFVPTRALSSYCRDSGLEWAISGVSCPGAVELDALRVKKGRIDNWLDVIHFWIGGSNSKLKQN